jgi:hypothetical protein
MFKARRGGVDGRGLPDMWLMLAPIGPSLQKCDGWEVGTMAGVVMPWTCGAER